MDQKVRQEDIVGVKVGPPWFSIDLRALWRRYTEKPNIDPVGLVAQRFVQVFRDHGISPSQIPRLMPDITLDKLANPSALLAALTPEVLDRVANLFHIRREWLDGLGWRIYEWRGCYKHPEIFFRDIAHLDMEATLWPVIAFSKDDNLDYRKNREQPLILVTVEKIASWGETEIDRYHIYGDGWLWDYFKCRIQLKAMVRILHEQHDIVVPIFRVSPKMFKEIESGWRVPRHFFARRLRNVSLEDFVFPPEESRVAKESEELPVIERYIKAYDLRNYVGLPAKNENKSEVGGDAPTIYEFT